MNYKKIGLFITIIITIFSLKMSVSAAEPIQIYASSTSVTVGNSVVITVKTNDAMGKYKITSSNESVLSGGATGRGFRTPNEQTTYTFKAISAGTATVTFTPVDMALYSNYSQYTTPVSVTITVKAKPVIVLSGDSSLSSMSIDDATISPEFNKDTLEYTTELQPDTTKINIVATPNHGGASISGIGVREVTDGDNRLEIVVTAENGTTSTYVINARVKEFNPIEVVIDGENYTVVRKRSMIVPPENYTETSVTINGEEVPAYYSDITKYTLVSLKNSAGDQNFYIYKDGTYKLYKELTFHQTKICLLDFPVVPENYEKGIMVYNDENIEAYKVNTNSSYSLLYGMNVETGEEHYYRYESSENTIQIYDTEEVDLMNKKVEMYIYIIIGLLSLSFILLLILTILVFRKKPTKKSTNEVKVEKIEV